MLGITGSIAAYKAVVLVRELVKAGAEVRVIMTPAAKDFVTPLTLSTLSRNPVLTDLFDEQSWSNHVMLGRWADVFLIAPLSCNTLAKMAGGACDNLLLAVYLSATCPVVVAPAMDEDMWYHPSTRANLAKLEAYGNRIIPVGKGELASGLNGEGRMAEPEEILQYLSEHLFSNGPLQGKKALVTAGPTYEPIDPVRFIGNHSSGKMGVVLAETLHALGAKVHLVLGPSKLQVSKGIKTSNVFSADDMYAVCKKEFSKVDMAIFAAAVADYTPKTVSNQKIKKNDAEFSIVLKKNVDIAYEFGKVKKPNQLSIGFALETNDEMKHAKGKLSKKNFDIVILNSLNDKGAGFQFNTNKITIINRNNKITKFELKSKEQVALDITHAIEDLLK